MTLSVKNKLCYMAFKFEKSNVCNGNKIISKIPLFFLCCWDRYIHFIRRKCETDLSI